MEEHLAALSLQLDDALEDLGRAQLRLLYSLNDEGVDHTLVAAATMAFHDIAATAGRRAAFEAKVVAKNRVLHWRAEEWDPFEDERPADAPPLEPPLPRLEVKALLRATNPEGRYGAAVAVPLTPGGSRGATVDETKVCFLEAPPPETPKSGGGGGGGGNGGAGRRKSSVRLFSEETVSEAFTRLAGADTAATGDDVDAAVWPIPPPMRLPMSDIELDQVFLRLHGVPEPGLSRAPMTFLRPLEAYGWLRPSDPDEPRALALGNASDADWLAQRYGIAGTRRVEVRPGWVRLAFAPEPEEEELFADLARLETPFVPAIKALLQRRNCGKVLVYDVGENMGACQLWFALQSLGVPVAVLDGGLRAWKACQLPMEELRLRLDDELSEKSAGAPRPRRRRSNFNACSYLTCRFTDIAPDIFVGADQILEMRKAQELRIIARQHRRRRSSVAVTPWGEDESELSSLDEIRSVTTPTGGHNALLSLGDRGGDAEADAIIKDPTLEQDVQLWDLRTALEYSGAFLNEPAARAGRIPWSRNLPTDVFQQHSHNGDRSARSPSPGEADAHAQFDAFSKLQPVGAILEGLMKHGLAPPPGRPELPGATDPLPVLPFEDLEDRTPRSMQREPISHPYHCFYGHRIGEAAFVALVLHAIGWELQWLRIYDEGWVDWSTRLDLPVARWTQTIPVRVGQREILIPPGLARLKCGPVPKGIDEHRGMDRAALLTHLRHDEGDGFDFDTAATQLRWQLETNAFQEIRTEILAKPLGMQLQNFGGLPLVKTVTPGLSADRAGVQEGDIVLFVGGDAEEVGWVKAVALMQAEPCPMLLVLARLN